jgi:hypothetical protein
VSSEREASSPYSWERLNRLRERVSVRDAVREVKDGGNENASPLKGGVARYL